MPQLLTEFPTDPNPTTLQIIGSSFPSLPQRTLTNALHVANIEGDTSHTPLWDTPLLHPRTALPPWGSPGDAPQVSSLCWVAGRGAQKGEG